MLALFFFVLTMCPYLVQLSGGPRASQLALHLILLPLGLLIIFFNMRRLTINPLLRGFSLLAVGFFLYSTVLTMIVNPGLTYADVLDLVRPIVYLFYVFVGYCAVDIRVIDRIPKWIIGIAVGQVLFSCLVFVPEMWGIVDLYKARQSSGELVNQFFRFSGTWGFPSDFSFLLMTAIGVILLQSRAWTLKRWLLLGVCVFGVIFTGSRAGVVALIATGAAYFFLKPNNGYGRVRIAVLSVLAIVFTSYFAADSNAVKYLMRVFDEGLLASGVQHRVLEFELLIGTLSDTALVGVGANAAYVAHSLPVLESAWGVYGIQFGLVGLIWLYLMFLYIARAAYAAFSRETLSKLCSTRELSGALLIATLLAAFIYAPSSAIVDRYKGLPFYFFLVGAGFYCISKREGFIDEVQWKGR